MGRATGKNARSGEICETDREKKEKCFASTI
jgi:hypothetical protein